MKLSQVKPNQNNPKTDMLKITKVKLSKLNFNNGQVEGLPKNPRFIRNEKYKKLLNSLREDPEMIELREIVAYDNNGELVVIMGNMRLRALRELGETETTVKILPTETPVEKLKAYTIKDNVSFGEHDWDELANNWDSEPLKEWGVDVTNWETQDYSDKNKEVDVNEFDDEMIIKLKYTEEDYSKVKEQLSRIAATPEQAVWKLLGNE